MATSLLSFFLYISSTFLHFPFSIYLVFSFSLTRPSGPGQSKSQHVCMSVCVMSIPHAFFRPFIGPEITWSVSRSRTGQPSLPPCLPPSFRHFSPMLFSAHIERVSVSRMQDFSIKWLVKSISLDVWVYLCVSLCPSAPPNPWLRKRCGIKTFVEDHIPKLAKLRE